MTADELRHFRKRLGMSQGQFARVLDMSISQLGVYERGIDTRTGKSMPVPRWIELACMAPASVWLQSSEDEATEKAIDRHHRKWLRTVNRMIVEGKR